MTSYAQNLDQLFITFSLPFGLAGGVLLVAANIIVIKYFDKRLPLAFGENFCYVSLYSILRCC